MLNEIQTEMAKRSKNWKSPFDPTADDIRLCWLMQEVERTKLSDTENSNRFFMVIPGDNKNLFEVMKVLGGYNVVVKVIFDFNTEDPKSLSLMVFSAPEDVDDHYRSCEATFQITFHQTKHYVCPFCKEKYDVPFCGHLVFGGKIKSRIVPGV